MFLTNFVNLRKSSGKCSIRFQTVLNDYTEIFEKSSELFAKFSDIFYKCSVGFGTLRPVFVMTYLSQEEAVEYCPWNTIHFTDTLEYTTGFLLNSGFSMAFG